MLNLNIVLLYILLHRSQVFYANNINTLSKQQPGANLVERTHLRARCRNGQASGQRPRN
jgi:hypothetical protein